jgi:hypothetical protein
LPAFVLFLMSPLIAEVLLGATRLTKIGGLILVAPFYGCGVLLIRELVRRRTTSWWPVVLFGAAYMLVEEGLTLQTLFNPDFVNAAKLGGRWLGVNFVLTQWELGYHIVWGICIPILATELLFPDRRTQPWLGPLGVSVCAIVFALAVSKDRDAGLSCATLASPDHRRPGLCFRACCADLAESEGTHE